MALVGYLPTMASGLYILSGGDFRPVAAKCILHTTTPDEIVEITPYAVRLLSIYNNPSFEGPWGVKTNGQRFDFTSLQNIRQGNE